MGSRLRGREETPGHRLGVLAQSGRAVDCLSACQGFESPTPRQFLWSLICALWYVLVKTANYWKQSVN